MTQRKLWAGETIPAESAGLVKVGTEGYRQGKKIWSQCQRKRENQAGD